MCEYVCVCGLPEAPKELVTVVSLALRKPKWKGSEFTIWAIYLVSPKLVRPSIARSYLKDKKKNQKLLKALEGLQVEDDGRSSCF